MGKTTLLEAISLIGELSCMRRLTFEGKELKSDEPSILVSNNHRVSKPGVFDAVVKDVRENGGIKRWFDKYDPEELDSLEYAAVKYELEADSSNHALNIYVCFRQKRSDKDYLSISQVLSRGSCDDFETNDRLAILLIPDGDERLAIDSLINYFYSISPHWDSNSHIYIKGNDQAEPIKGVVSFVNTDQNDFGKRFNVKESVKDIRRDLKGEICTRLGLLKGDGSTYEYLDKLNELLEKVVRDFEESKYGRSKKSKSVPLIKITTLSYQNGDERPDFKIDRLGGGGRPVDDLSAGENECFFIFMLLLSLAKPGSIIALDEPDLHLATFSKGIFFSCLYDLIEERGCQLIVSTHSGFSYSGSDKYNLGRLVIKKEVKNSKTHFEAKDDPVFALRLSYYYLKAAIRCISIVSKLPNHSFLGACRQIVRHWMATLPAMRRIAVQTGLMAMGTMMLAFVIAIFSDFLRRLGFQSSHLQNKPGNTLPVISHMMQILGDHDKVIHIVTNIVIASFLTIIVSATIYYFLPDKDDDEA